MNREETAEAIKVMQHWVDGGEVESRAADGSWTPFATQGQGHWFGGAVFRMAPQRPPTCPPEIVALLKYAPEWAVWLVCSKPLEWSIWQLEPSTEYCDTFWGYDPECECENLAYNVPAPADWQLCKWKIGDLLER